MKLRTHRNPHRVLVLGAEMDSDHLSVAVQHALTVLAQEIATTKNEGWRAALLVSRSHLTDLKRALSE